MGNTLSRCFGKREKPKVTKTSKSKRKSKLTALEIAMFSEAPKKNTYMGLPLEDQTASNVSNFGMSLLWHECLSKGSFTSENV